MATDRSDDPDLRELVEGFPIGPIEDDQSYRAALAILDRLFRLDDHRTPAQRTYFRDLARHAHEYEQVINLV